MFVMLQVSKYYVHRVNKTPIIFPEKFAFDRLRNHQFPVDVLEESSLPPSFSSHSTGNKRGTNDQTRFSSRQKIIVEVPGDQ